jgi:hypothetical protein
MCEVTKTAAMQFSEITNINKTAGEPSTDFPPGPHQDGAVVATFVFDDAIQCSNVTVEVKTTTDIALFEGGSAKGEVAELLTTLLAYVRLVIVGSILEIAEGAPNKRLPTVLARLDR